MSLTAVTVTGLFVQPGGTPPTKAEGAITFSLSHALQDTAGNVIVAPVEFKVTLVNGAFSVVLPALDDPGVMPAGVRYDVLEQIVGATSRSYPIILEAARPAVDLADLLPTVVGAPAYPYVLQSVFQAAVAGRQPLDADLTAIAALDSATAGALATDGAGWVQKTYAQLKTSLALAKSDVGLGNASNTSDALKPVSTAQAAINAAKADLVSGFVPDAQISAAIARDAEVTAAVAAERTFNSGTYVAVLADAAALRARAPAVGTVQVLGQGDYRFDAGSTFIDNGGSVIRPTAIAQTSAGRWLQVRETTAVPFFGQGLKNIALARTRPFRVLMATDSIGNFGNSPNMVAYGQMRRQFGDSGADIQPFTSGGSNSGTVQGWPMQAYGGLRFGRLVGLSGNPNDYTADGYFDELVIQHSREADAQAVDVLIDGVVVGQTAGPGAQQYGLRSVFTVALGYHTWSVRRPTGTGKVYLEFREQRRSDRLGLELLDGTIGGASLYNTVNPPTALFNGTNGPAGPTPAVVGFNGVDAIFGRDDVDLIFMEYVNDAGNNVNDTLGGFQDWKVQVDRVIEVTRLRATSLVLIVPMAAHYALPVEFGNTRLFEQFRAIREYMIRLGRDNNHVLTVDWHGMTVLADLVAYAARFYPQVTGLNVTTGAYTGDFIHPSVQGHQVGAAAVCQALGIAPPERDNNLRLGNLAKTDEPDFYARDTIGTIEGRRVLMRPPLAKARKYGSGELVPIFRDDTIVNESTFRASIAASPLIDPKFGRYLSNAQPSSSIADSPGVDFAAGERAILSVLMRARADSTQQTFGVRAESAALRFFLNGQQLPFSSGARTDFVDANSDGVPVWLTVEIGGTGIGGMTFTGDLFDMSIVKGTLPVVSEREPFVLREIGLPGLLIDDPAFNPILLGQTFIEMIAGTAVEKRLVGPALKWDFTTQTNRRTGLYDYLDRTAAGRRLRRPITDGTSTIVTGTGIGSSVDRVRIGLQFSEFTAVDISTAGSLSVSTKSVDPALFTQRIRLVGNGLTRFLAPDGTWSATAQSFRSLGRSKVGRNMVVTFPVPTELAATLGNTVTLTADMPVEAGSPDLPFAPAVLSRTLSGSV